MNFRFNKIVILLLIFTGMVVFLIQIQKSSQTHSTEKISQNQNKLDIMSETINQIYIDGNFSETASTYGWCSGLGTAASPYIIQNLTIDGQNNNTCIYIKDIMDFFIIRNCTILNSKNDGIYLYKVKNGTFYNNTIKNNLGDGLDLRNSDNISIRENVIHNNSGRCISLDASVNNTIRNNTAYNDYFGIELWHSHNNNISNNVIHDNIGVGINLQYSNNNMITRNLVYNGHQTSCTLFRSDNNRITNNIFLNNWETIYELECEGNTIQNNVLHQKKLDRFEYWIIIAFWFIIIGGWGITVFLIRRKITLT